MNNLQATGLQWDGARRWSDALYPDSSFNLSLEAFAAPDGNGGAYIAHTTEAPSEWLSQLRLLHRQDDGTLAVGIYALTPIPGTTPFVSSAFRVWGDALGRAVLCLHCDGESSFGARGAPRLLIVDSDGQFAGSDPEGTKVFPVGFYSSFRLESDSNGDVFASCLELDASGTARHVIAQRMHADQPVATLASRVSGGRVRGGVELTWQLSGDAATVALVERSVGDMPYEAFASLAPDGDGRVRVLDLAAPSEARLRYRLSVAGLVLDIWELTAHSPPGLSLALGRTTDGEVAARITLEGVGDARLDVFDVAGRLQRSEDLSDRGAGTHELALPGAGPPGLRLVRLREGGAQRVVRYASLR